jgi:endonuclease YncB( thermonuclease family)
MGQREFPGVISKVEDGDTVYVWCDMGYDTWRYTKLRLVKSLKVGIAARELSMPGGKEARDFLIGLLPPRTYPTDGPTCIIYSYKWDKYAPRIDGDILLYNGRTASELMIESGYATPWDGKGTQPLPQWPLPPIPGSQGSLFIP